jgi:alanine dehydrogenase
MRVGVPRERQDQEYRVGCQPDGVASLTRAGHEVLVERGAGEQAGISDAQFSAAGAVLTESDEIWAVADLVLKVKAPVPPEYPKMRPGQVVFCYLHLAAAPGCTRAILEAGVIAIGYETVQLNDGSLPLLAPMSQLAGRMAPLVGAHVLERASGGRGVLLGGVPGVAPASVVIIGAGVAGVGAAAVASGMRARVTLLDVSLDRLRSADQLFRGQVQTVAATQLAIEHACVRADLVIGAVLVPGARAPHVVSDALVAEMAPGSALIDLAVDQGGCFESARATTLHDPTFQVAKSTFYCVANMPAALPGPATKALTRATLPYAERIAAVGWQAAARSHSEIARGVNAVHGELTSEPVAQAHGLRAVGIDELLAVA